MNRPRIPAPIYDELVFLIEYVPQSGDMEAPRIASTAELRLAFEVFELAKRHRPGRVLILRHGARILTRHEPDLA